MSLLGVLGFGILFILFWCDKAAIRFCLCLMKALSIFGGLLWSGQWPNSALNRWLSTVESLPGYVWSEFDSKDEIQLQESQVKRETKEPEIGSGSKPLLKNIQLKPLEEYRLTWTWTTNTPKKLSFNPSTLKTPRFKPSKIQGWSP